MKKSDTITIDGNEISIYNDTDKPVAVEDIPSVITSPDYDGQIYDASDECWSNGPDGLYLYRMDDGRNLYVDVVQVIDCITITDDSPIGHLRDWYANISDDDDEDEWLSEWDLAADDHLVAVPDDYDGPCRVWHAPCYYSTHNNRPTGYWARDDDVTPPDNEYVDPKLSPIHVFVNRADAQDYINDYYTAPSGYDGIPACNVLSHGQAGSDTLIIVAAD